MGEDEEAAGPSRRLCSGGAGGSDYSDSDESPLIQSELDGDDERMEDERDGIVRIRIPPGEERSTDPHARFPKERGKTLFACGLLVTAGVSNTIVLSAVHEKVPETPPLPDFIFALTPYFPYGLVLAEYIMLSMFVMTVTLVLFHRHRWIVMRRLAFLGALLYFCRCVTMFVTQVPVADVNYHCSPKLKGENATFLNVLIRGLEVVTGLGLQVAGKHVLCGDYIYSGHTIVLTISALFIGQYTPRRWRLVHWTAWILAIAGMFLLIVSRGHYTIDVIISYVICTRVFYAYHTQAANPSLRIRLPDSDSSNPRHHTT